MQSRRSNQKLRDQLQQIQQAGNSSTPMLGTNNGGTGVSSGPFGQVFDQDSFRYTDHHFDIVIVKEGPNGETSIDGSYWAREVYLFQESQGVDTVTLWIKGDGFWGKIIHLPEVVAGSHLLPEFDAGTGTDDIQVDDDNVTTMRVFQVDGISQNGEITGNYLFVGTAGSNSAIVSFLITTASDNDWEYNAKSIGGEATPGSLGTEAAEDDLLVQNLPEWGLTDATHHVTDAANCFSKYGFGRVVGKTGGKRIVQTEMYWTSCSPPTTGDGTYAPPASIEVENGFVVAASE